MACTGSLAVPTIAFPVRGGDEPGSIGTDRIANLAATDWGWWRTLTLNLERLRLLATAGGAPLVPVQPTYDLVGQIEALAEAVRTVPKTVGWRMRAKIGDRKRWYRLPEEDAHA